MKKPEKNKSEKKKTGKKKTAGDDLPKFSSKALQRDFDKKMKSLVREVKKETQATLKTVLKEAKRKLSEGSELVMNDVLNSIVTTVGNAEAAVTGKKGLKAEKAQVALTESDGEATAGEAEMATPRTGATRATGPRKTKSTALTAIKKPIATRTRRIAAAEEAIPEAPVAEAPAPQDQE